MSTATLESSLSTQGKVAVETGHGKINEKHGTAEESTEVRHSSRLRKPSRRAVEEMEISKTETEEQSSEDVKKVSGKSKSLSAEPEKGDEKFCVCRKGDDGKPMVLCAECNEWFHFKCVGLTKKAAESLTEFTCSTCSEIKKVVPSSEAVESTVSNASEQADDADIVESKTISPKRKLQEPDVASKRARSQQTESSPSRQTLKSSPPVPSPTSGVQTSRKLSSSSIAPSTNAKNTNNSSAITAQRVRSDNLRKHAEQQFAAIFHEIMSESDEKMDEEKLNKKSQLYANTFEDALFGSTNEVVVGANLRVAGKTYRDRLRSFMFNLKDKTNKSLRSRIADGSLSADDLSIMSNEELANDEIRKEVERRKKENLEQSILKKDKAPLRKLTHKGEIDIDYENREDSRMAEDANHSSALHSRKVVDKESSTSNKSDQPGEKSSSTSLPALKETQLSSESSRRISQSIQSPTLQFDFKSVWQGDQDSSEREGEDDDSGQDEGTKEEDVGGVSIMIHDGINDLQHEEEDAEHADDFIDNFLGIDEDEGVESNKGQSQQGEDEKPKIGWQGSINMPDEGLFSCSVRQIAGRELEEEEWTHLFPSPFSLIEGRLPSRSAIPYLLESRIAARTELVAFIAEPTFVANSIPDKIKITTESENNDAFEHLLHYFTNKDRYGVLQPLRSARGQTVKDFYMASLPKDHEIPEWLALLSPKLFSDQMASSRQQDLFLLVAVLFRHNVTNNTYRPMQGNNEKNITPPTNVNSTTLQDLLRAVGGQGRGGSNQTPPNVGGGGTPSTPLHLGNQSYQSSSSFSKTSNEDGIVPASSVQALSELPKPQLEDVLTKNPNLVEDLLRTLSKSSSSNTTTKPIIAPPGPPPPRPPAAAFGMSSGQVGYGGIAQQDHNPGYPGSGDQGYYSNYPQYGQEFNNNNPHYQQNDSNAYGQQQGYNQNAAHSYNHQQNQQGGQNSFRGGRRGRWH